MRVIESENVLKQKRKTSPALKKIKKQFRGTALAGSTVRLMNLNITPFAVHLWLYKFGSWGPMGPGTPIY
jgi:hypothetical protein